MGKTYRNVYAGSNSKDYHSPHNRGFAKEKKQYSHKQLRVSNNNCDEDNYKTMRDIKKMNNHFASSFYNSQLGNIPNKPDRLFTDKDLYRNYGTKWEKTDGNHYHFINRLIEEGHKDDYLQMCKKQIERRGKLGLYNDKNVYYKPHLEDNNFSLYDLAEN